MLSINLHLQIIYWELMLRIIYSFKTGKMSGKTPSIKIHGKSLNYDKISSIKPAPLPDTSKPKRKALPSPLSITSETSLDLTNLNAAPELLSDTSDLSSDIRVEEQFTPENEIKYNSPKINSLTRPEAKKSVSKGPSIRHRSNNGSVVQAVKLNITSVEPDADDKRSVAVPRANLDKSKNTQVPPVVNPAPLPVSNGNGGNPHFIGNNMTDRNMPNFAAMKPEEVTAYRQELLTALREMRINFPELNIEIPEPATVEQLYSIYFVAMKHIVIQKSVSGYRLLLIFSWMIMERICTDHMGINLTGYTELMIEDMVRYEILLYRIKEKNFTLLPGSGGETADPLTELIKASAMNALLIVAINKFGNFLPEGAMKWVKGNAVPFIAKKYTHPTLPTPPNKEQIENEKLFYNKLDGFMKMGKKLFVSQDNPAPPPQEVAAPDE